MDNQYIIEACTQALTTLDPQQRITKLWYAELLIKQEIFKLEIDEQRNKTVQESESDS